MHETVVLPLGAPVFVVVVVVGVVCLRFRCHGRGIEIEKRDKQICVCVSEKAWKVTTDINILKLSARQTPIELLHGC